MLPVAEIVSTRSPRVTVAVSSLLARTSEGCVQVQPHHATAAAGASVSSVSSGSTPAWRRDRRRIAGFVIDCKDAIVTPPGLLRGTTSPFPSRGGSGTRVNAPPVRCHGAIGSGEGGGGADGANHHPLRAGARGRPLELYSGPFRHVHGWLTCARCVCSIHAA